MPFAISHEAKKDLRSIGLYTQRKWGKKQRRKYLSALWNKFQFLFDNPLVCRERKELNRPVRIYRQGNHLIIYVIRDESILIVRVLHTSMDIELLLEE